MLSMGVSCRLIGRAKNEQQSSHGFYCQAAHILIKCMPYLHTNLLWMEVFVKCTLPWALDMRCNSARWRLVYWIKPPRWWRTCVFYRRVHTCPSPTSSKRRWWWRAVCVTCGSWGLSSTGSATAKTPTDWRGALHGGVSTHFRISLLLACCWAISVADFKRFPEKWPGQESIRLGMGDLI